MRKVLIGTGGLIFVALLALLLRDAQYGRKVTSSGNSAEEQRLRHEIQTASERLRRIAKPRQFLPR